MPPSVDDMASMGLWAANGTTVDMLYLHWDLHTEIRRIEGENAETAGSEKLYGRYLERINNACGHRVLFVTGKGYMGLGSWNAKVHDRVCVLKGADTPFLLRAHPTEGSRHTLVGESYVVGIMEGEAMEEEGAEERMQTFWII